MKKVISCLFVVVFAMIALFGGIVHTFASAYEEECDIVFQKALQEIMVEEAISAETIKVIKEPVYDISLDQLGFIYLMQYEEKEGFALVVNTDGIFEVSEFYMEGKNPYGEHDGLKIYVNLMFYLIWQDDCFIETSTGITVNDETLELLGQKAFYSAASTITTGQEIIYYTNKTENPFELAMRHPCYFPVDLSNACVVAAGANIIGFYDRFFENLIPNYVPGSPLAQYYLYKEFSSDVYPMMSTLYNYMKTNVTAPGTTIPEFKTGMTRYVSEKGFSISYNSCMQSGNFNFNSAKQRLESGMPLVLFLDTYTVTTLVPEDQKDSLLQLLSTACHAMAGFGYNEITYTLTSGQTRTDKYIAVATGLSEKMKGYFNINYNTQIDECYGINIY